MRREKGLSFQCSLEYSIFKATAGRAICLIIVYLNVLLKEIQNFFSFFPLSTAVRSACIIRSVNWVLQGMTAVMPWFQAEKIHGLLKPNLSVTSTCCGQIIISTEGMIT